MFERLKRRFEVDVGQGELDNAAATNTVRDQRAKRWELKHIHGQCSANVGGKSGIRKRMRR